MAGKATGIDFSALRNEVNEAAAFSDFTGGLGPQTRERQRGEAGLEVVIPGTQAGTSTERLDDPRIIQSLFNTFNQFAVGQPERFAKGGEGSGVLAGNYMKYFGLDQRTAVAAGKTQAAIRAKMQEIGLSPALSDEIARHLTYLKLGKESTFDIVPRQWLEKELKEKGIDDELIIGTRNRIINGVFDGGAATGLKFKVESVAAPRVIEEGKPSVPPPPSDIITTPKPVTVPTSELPQAKEERKAAEKRILSLGELQAPQITPFEFTPSGKGAEIEKQQIGVGTTDIEKVFAKTSEEGKEALASRGRRGGVLTEFQQEVAGGKAKELGELRIEAAGTRAGIEADERKQAFKGFISTKADELQSFGTEVQAKQAGIDNLLTKLQSDQQFSFEDAQAALEGMQSQFNLILKAREIDIRNQIGEGKMTLKQGEIAMEQTKNGLIKLQNDTQAILNKKINSKLTKDEQNSIAGLFQRGYQWIKDNVGGVLIGEAVGGTTGFFLGGPPGAAAGAAAGGLAGGAIQDKVL